MKDELMKKLLDWINNIESFTKEQIPDFAEQVVKWAIFEALCGISMCIVSSILFFIIYSKSYEKYKIVQAKDKWDGDGLFVLAVISALLCAVVLIFPLNICIFQMVKAIVSPKLYLIDYFIKK